MTLDAFEFMRRFLLHILPHRFVKIRHYGILSNKNRKTKLKLCKELLGVARDDIHYIKEETWAQQLFRLIGIDYSKCPCCKKGTMIKKAELQPKCCSPPEIKGVVA